MFLRPTMSEVDDQMNRPAMLAALSSATKPVAAVARTGVEDVLKKSTSIGAAFSRMPMPAVTLKHSTTQSSQNCGVLIALFAETLKATVALGLSLRRAAFSSVNSLEGRRTSSTPTLMKIA